MRTSKRWKGDFIYEEKCREKVKLKPWRVFGWGNLSRVNDALYVQGESYTFPKKIQGNWMPTPRFIQYLSLSRFLYFTLFLCSTHHWVIFFSLNVITTKNLQRKYIYTWSYLERERERERALFTGVDEKDGKRWWSVAHSFAHPSVSPSLTDPRLIAFNKNVNMAAMRRANDSATLRPRNRVGIGGFKGSLK